VYSWKGLDVEVDETKYDWGTVFEIECETVSGPQVVPTIQIRVVFAREKRN